tara:strand:+ start:210 stop:440 length:231 start_codon:yes stop_codon:yes gene_type:complete
MKLAMSGSDNKVIDILPLIKKRKEMQAKKEMEPTLSDVADVLVRLMIILDGINQFDYANRISEILEDMFESPDLEG